MGTEVFAASRLPGSRSKGIPRRSNEIGRPNTGSPRWAARNISAQVPPAPLNCAFPTHCNFIDFLEKRGSKPWSYSGLRLALYSVPHGIRLRMGLHQMSRLKIRY